MKIMESGENYLETILILQERLGEVRSVDIANELGFSKPSVSVAMKQFRENGYILVDANGHISLTELGMSVAKKVYERHEVLSRLLISIGVSHDVALEDACRIEHDISEETFERLKACLPALEKN